MLRTVAICLMMVAALAEVVAWLVGLVPWYVMALVVLAVVAVLLLDARNS